MLKDEDAFRDRLAVNENQKQQKLRLEWQITDNGYVVLHVQGQPVPEYILEVSLQKDFYYPRYLYINDHVLKYQLWSHRNYVTFNGWDFPWHNFRLHIIIDILFWMNEYSCRARNFIDASFWNEVDIIKWKVQSQRNPACFILISKIHEIMLQTWTSKS